jgi:hypothetical protein
MVGPERMKGKKPQNQYYGEMKIPHRVLKRPISFKCSSFHLNPLHSLRILLISHKSTSFFESASFSAS